jgi:hypothetical protein
VSLGQNLKVNSFKYIQTVVKQRTAISVITSLPENSACNKLGEVLATASIVNVPKGISIKLRFSICFFKQKYAKTSLVHL